MPLRSSSACRPGTGWGPPASSGSRWGAWQQRACLGLNKSMRDAILLRRPLVFSPASVLVSPLLWWTVSFLMSKTVPALPDPQKSSKHMKWIPRHMKVFCELLSPTRLCPRATAQSRVLDEGEQATAAVAWGLSAQSWPHVLDTGTKAPWLQALPDLASCCSTRLALHVFLSPSKTHIHALAF